MNIKQQRIRYYWFVGIALTLSYFFLKDVEWQGSTQLHTIMEVLATVLALFVGLLALLLFYSRGGLNFLVLGAGFIGVAFLDGYHGLVTSLWFKHCFPSDLPSLIPWSWLASRLFLSLVLLFYFIVIKREADSKPTQLFTPRTIYGITFVLILSSFVFFASVPLPSAYSKDTWFDRPAEIIPVILFLITLMGFIKLGRWKQYELDHWLMFALVVNLVSQFVFMPYSDTLFDMQFDMAHLLKKVSYLCVLVGLSISVFKVFKKVELEVISRKNMQMALEASEVRNRTLMNSLTDGLITINEQGIVESFNKAASDLFGYSKLEVLGKNIKMLMPSPYQENHDAYLSTYKKTGKAKIIGLGSNVIGLKKSGSTFPLDLTISEMMIGNQKKFSGIVRDDTARQLAEAEIIKSKNEAEMAAQAKTSFLATMSHEIRTPMNGVLGMVEILQDTPLNEKQQDIIKTISESGYSLLEIINDILEFSKVEAGKIKLDIAPFNIERTVFDVTRLLIVKAEEKNIELIFYCHDTCPDYVVGDAGRIRQVILNLVGNAIKFTHEGQVFVEVSCPQQTETDCEIRIEVKDTGIGIEQKVREKLFESFTQADGSTSRKYGGTGLGLSISRQLVELMGGTMGVDSEIDKGSTFWVTLNFEKSTSPEKLEQVDLSGVKILVVDDNPVNLHVLREQLLSWNMNVDEVSNPKEAMDCMLTAEKSTKGYKLAVISSLMSELSGEDLGRQIKSHDLLKDIPLVILASATGRGTAAVFKEIGFSAYITKPILSKLLHGTLSRVLGLDINKNNFLTRHTVMDNEFDSCQKNLELKGSILLVEDVVINQKVALGLMDGMGLDIDVAENGEEALDKFSQNKYDLILMDCQMPVMDGFEATRKIREQDKSITIIAVTANALSSDRLNCIDAGMNDYLSKPFNRKQLADVLLRWLGKDVMTEDSSNTENDSSIVETKQEPVDFNKLSEMKKAMGSVFEQLLPAYIQQSDEMIDDMMIMLDQQDLKTLERYAHSMKSSSYNVGANTLADMSMKLEDMSRNNADYNELKTEIEAVCAEYGQVKKILLQYQ